MLIQSVTICRSNLKETDAAPATRVKGASNKSGSRIQPTLQFRMKASLQLLPERRSWQTEVRNLLRERAHALTPRPQQKSLGLEDFAACACPSGKQPCGFALHFLPC